MNLKRSPAGPERQPKPPTIITKMILVDGRGGVIGAVDVEMSLGLYNRTR